ncbi:MAG: hypothetical protein C4562_05750 [Actinobacteria bacterium]|nr:MAG: hypothetical protein C4562_05750 [Actinomycetota bacterium]
MNQIRCFSCERSIHRKGPIKHRHSRYCRLRGVDIKGDLLFEPRDCSYHTPRVDLNKQASILSRITAPAKNLIKTTKH